MLHKLLAPVAAGVKMTPLLPTNVEREFAALDTPRRLPPRLVRPAFQAKDVEVFVVGKLVATAFGSLNHDVDDSVFTIGRRQPGRIGHCFLAHISTKPPASIDSSESDLGFIANRQGRTSLSFLPVCGWEARPEGYFANVAVQWVTRLIGKVRPCSAVITRKRFPSGLTSYGDTRPLNV